MFALKELLPPLVLTSLRTIILTVVGIYISNPLGKLYFTIGKKFAGKDKNLDEVIPVLSSKHKWVSLLQLITGLFFIDMAYIFNDRWYMGIFIGIGIIELFASIGNFIISQNKDTLTIISLFSPDGALKYAFRKPLQKF